MCRILLNLICGMFLIAAGPCGEMLPEDSEKLSDGGAICTEIGCHDEFIVQIIRADNDAFQAGEYLFEIETPEKVRWSATCYAGYGEAGLDCSTSDKSLLFIQLIENGNAIELWLFGAPERATVVVYYNGSEIGHRNFVPIYDTIMPNGPDCPPTCLHANEAMAVQSW